MEGSLNDPVKDQNGIRDAQALKVDQNQVNILKYVSSKRWKDVCNVFLSIDIHKELESLEQSIQRAVTVQADVHYLKTRRNALVPINRLPVELLSIIILLSASPTSELVHPYLSYTWVCHHWRSVTIQNPAFWTFIRHESRSRLRRSRLQFTHELICRSKSSSAKLDVILPGAIQFQDFFAPESHRIRHLWFTSHLQLDLSNRSFPSLRKLILSWSNRSSTQSCDIFGLLPALQASNDLEILECTLSDRTNPSVGRLAPLFSQIKRLKLNLESCSPTFIQSTLALLHNSVKLQNLEFTSRYLGNVPSLDDCTVLPELKILWTNTPYLLDHIRAPKLVELTGAALDRNFHRVFDEFNFSSIRHFYLRYSGRDNSFLGSAEGEQSKMGKGISEIFFEDVFPDYYPQNRFYIQLQTHDTSEIFGSVQTISSAILPRMSNLIELCLLVSNSTFDIQDFITKVPSVETLLIRWGGETLAFLRLLSTPAFCPRLKELAYQADGIYKTGARHAQSIGKTLLECLQQRRKHGHRQLDKITLQNCPQLPDIYIEKLQQLNTTVVCC